VGLFAALCLAAPAGASDGGGLYEPFPKPAPSAQVREFVSHLPRGGRALGPGLTDTELERGLFPTTGLTQAGQPGAASRRAADVSSPAFLEGWPAALAIVAALLGAGALAIRRAA
jgi:hypothetical protein